MSCVCADGIVRCYKKLGLCWFTRMIYIGFEITSNDCDYLMYRYLKIVCRNNSSSWRFCLAYCIKI